MICERVWVGPWALKGGIDSQVSTLTLGPWAQGLLWAGLSANPFCLFLISSHDSIAFLQMGKLRIG